MYKTFEKYILTTDSSFYFSGKFVCACVCACVHVWSVGGVWVCVCVQSVCACGVCVRYMQCVRVQGVYVWYMIMCVVYDVWCMIKCGVRSVNLTKLNI